MIALGLYVLASHVHVAAGYLLNGAVQRSSTSAQPGRAKITGCRADFDKQTGERC